LQKDGWAAVHLATGTINPAGPLPALRALLESGADMDLKTTKGYSILDIAEFRKMGDEVAALLNTKEKMNCPTNVNKPMEDSSLTPLQQAAQEGDLNKVRFLVLTCKAEVDAFGPRGSTALHEASFAGQPDVIKFLVSNGANPNLPKVRYNILMAYRI
jgi:ankyrin repeat protein